MIVVRVELHSAVTGVVSEIARMDICNVGGTNTCGDYGGTTYRGRDREALAKRAPSKHAEVINHPRLRQHVWNLIARMLANMGYK